jgi:FMN-dependent NADH-azoreductase
MAKEPRLRILHVDSSPKWSDSASRQLSAAVVAHWSQSIPNCEVVHRDVGRQPIRHLDGSLLARMQPGSKGTADLDAEREWALTDTLVREFLDADGIVIGAPMYNHSVPSQLKAWIDRICIAGRTFRYTASGPVGLVPDKPVIIASSRGGVYAAPTQAGLDFQEPYLKSILGLLGVHSVRVCRAEGLDITAETRAAGFATAMAQLESFFGTR